MEPLLLKHGYALLFAGIAVEGEAVLLAAALLAQRGFLRFPVVVAVAAAANSLADQVYQLARLRGREWLERRFGHSPRYRRLLDLDGYKNLFQFKKKSAPRRESRHLVYPRGADLPAVAMALASVHEAGGLRRLVLGR